MGGLFPKCEKTSALTLDYDESLLPLKPVVAIHLAAPETLRGENRLLIYLPVVQVEERDV